MDIVGQPIQHQAFGPGIVTSLTGKTVTVRFQDGEKKFIYPDAFSRFLVLKNAKLQKNVRAQIEDRENAIREKRRSEQEEYNRRQKLLNFKIEPNSHVILNIPPEQTAQAIDTHTASTGKYLSGYSKGRPRIAERLKPNSACLLTECPKGTPEKGRRITGAFMAGESFFGADASDGLIKGHPQYFLSVPKDVSIPLWKYAGRTAPPRWGNTVFRYCSGDTMNLMLSKLVKLLENTDQAEPTAEFYRYFCRINRLHPLIKWKEDGDPATEQ